MEQAKRLMRIFLTLRTKSHWILSALMVFYSVIAGGSTSRLQTIDDGWSNPTDISGGVTQNWRAFGVLACDPYQNTHVFWVDQTSRNEDINAAIYYRNNVNGIWSVPNDVLLVDDMSIYYLKAVISPKTDTIHLTWVNLNNNGVMYYSNAPLYQAGSSTGWRKPQVIATGVSNSDIDVDPSGRLHMVYSASNDNGINNEVNQIISTDNGEQWSDPNLIFSRSFPQPSSIKTWISIDGKGRIHLGLTLRSQEYGVYSEVGYINTLEDGINWGNYRMIDALGTAWQGVAEIEPYAFGEDEIHLTWHDPRRMHQWSMDGGKTWSQPEEIMPLGAAFGGPNELTKDSAGTVHVVTAILNGVFTAEWRDQRWSAPEQIEFRDFDPHSQNMIICQGNQLHVVYWDRTGPQTVWYSTHKVNAPAIGQQPIPKPTDNVQDTINQIEFPSVDEVATPTNNTIRETLGAVQAPNISSGITSSQLLSGVVPSVILILGVVLLALKKMRL